MKQPKIALIFLLLLITFQVSGQAGQVQELEYFNELKVFGPFRVILQKGSKEQIVIDARPQEYDLIFAEVNNERLKIRVKTDEDAFKVQPRIRVTLTYTDLREVIGEASAEILAGEPIKENRLRIQINSGAMGDLEIQTNQLDVSVATGGELEISGESNVQDAIVITGGAYDALSLECEETFIRARTGGEAKVRARKFVEARSTTGGNVIVRGNPGKRDLGSSLGGTIEVR